MALAVDSVLNSPTGFGGIGVTSITQTFVNTAGTRIVAGAHICAPGVTPSVSTIEYPLGTSLTNLTNKQTVPDVDVAFFEKITPATGSNSLKVTFSSNGDGTLGAFTVTGDGAGASTAATPTSTAGATSLAISKTTTSGNLFVAYFTSGQNAMSVDNTQFVLQNQSSAHSGDNGAAAYMSATGGTDTITMTLTVGSDKCSAVAIEIPSGTPPPPPTFSGLGMLAAMGI